MATVARIFINPLTRPVMRSDQAKEMLLIAVRTIKEKRRPPIPDPAALMPLAKLQATAFSEKSRVMEIIRRGDMSPFPDLRLGVDLSLLRWDY